MRVVADDELARLAGSDLAPGRLRRRRARTRTPTRTTCSPASDPLIVVLDEIQDPQNLGAIVRTAEGVGATGVVIPERRSAEVTPAVCKASAGAVEWARVARVRNVADYLGEREGGRLLVLRGRGRAGGRSTT